MAEIPGYMYIIIGAGVAIASVAISYLKLMVFILAGVVMVIVGIYKMSIAKNERQQKPHHAIQHTVAPPPTDHRVSNLIKYCPRCNTSSNINNYYCPRCGTQLISHRR